MATKSIGLTYYVEQNNQAVVVPVRKNIVNNYDHMGDIVSLPRIEGETNADYKKRLWDNNLHPSGPTYQGMLNGIARDLGMLRELAITIELKLDSSGEKIAPNPRVNILSNKVVLYSDWRPNETAVIDKEISFYKEEDPGYKLEELVSLINTSSSFSCTLNSGVRSTMPSSYLVRGKTDFIVQSDNVGGHNSNELTFKNIVQDSLIFGESNIFVTEVSGTPTEDGEYKVDYENSIVESKLLPSGAGSVYYHIMRFPYKVDYLPVQLYTLNDDDFQSELFDKKELDSGEEINYLLNAEGAEIYHQLYKDMKMFWGE